MQQLGDHVGKVLADALHGGGQHGGNLDALINSLPSHDAGASVADALASQAAHGVPNVDISAFAGFHGPHQAPVMEHLVMHQDAAPTHG